MLQTTGLRPVTLKEKDEYSLHALIRIHRVEAGKRLGMLGGLWAIIAGGAQPLTYQLKAMPEARFLEDVILLQQQTP